LQPCNQRKRKRKSPHFKSVKTGTSTRRRASPTTPPMPRPVQDTKGTPTATRATSDQETIPTGTENTASTANYKITLRTNVSRGFEKRNRAEIAKAEPIGPECM
jgi:hypothetical protein